MKYYDNNNFESQLVKMVIRDTAKANYRKGIVDGAILTAIAISGFCISKIASERDHYKKSYERCRETSFDD